uniref:Neutral/alkaline non-lysosomal ceramidase N-terminal domain-containing protein n=1 Tax=Zea mays TaxID=4577 RepID=A0A804PU48_MAIZE
MLTIFLVRLHQNLISLQSICQFIETSNLHELINKPIPELQPSTFRFTIFGRLKARAFIVAEPNIKRVMFVNLDACMASHLVTIKVLERLKARYGDLYNENNVAISGIHTHAGPGGYLQ